MSDQATADAILTAAYRAFNAREIEDVLKLLDPQVAWANGMEGGYVHGIPAVRNYWAEQWKVIDPTVQPTSFETEPDGRVVANVHQVVRDMEGAIRADVTVRHVYTFRDGLITQMDIERA